MKLVHRNNSEISIDVMKKQQPCITRIKQRNYVANMSMICVLLMDYLCRRMSDIWFYSAGLCLPIIGPLILTT